MEKNKSLFKNLKYVCAVATCVLGLNTIVNGHFSDKMYRDFIDKSGIGIVLDERFPKLYEFERILEAEKAIEEYEKTVQRKSEVQTEIKTLNVRLEELREKASKNPELQELIEKEREYRNRAFFPLSLFTDIDYMFGRLDWVNGGKLK